MNLLEPKDILRLYDKIIPTRHTFLVGSVNLHIVFCHKYNADVRSFFDRSNLIYVDGMPIVWWLKCLGEPAKTCHRATFVDWLPALMELARDRGWRVYYIGHRPGVTSRVAAQFKHRFPGLDIETGHGFFDHRIDSTDNIRVVDEINKFAPDILLVGMGTPLQQSWILENMDRLNATVIHACGATADYFAHVIPLPPRILGRLGLEGLYRLVSEPRRLWRRYLVEPLRVLDLALNDLRRVYVRR